MSSITNGKAYWRSLDEFVDSPDFQAHVDKEFPNLLPTDASPATRRQFLKVMGASLALAGVAGCDWDPRWPKAKILPYANRPDGQSPGSPQHFATSMELGGFARPVLVKSYDGRPIKIEGNPEHVASQGATDLLTQASILGLYDPDRSQSVARGGKVTSDWNQLLSDLRPALGGFRNAQGERIAILSEASSAPSLAEMRSRWNVEFPQSHWYEFEAVSRDNVREGSRLVFGSPYRPQYHLEQAEVIVSLDDDFLMNHPAAVAYTRAFARRRRAEDGTMNRLHVVESGYSITGSVADHRHPTPAAAIPQVAWALAARLFLDEGVPLPASMESIRGLLEPARRHGEHLPHVEKMARELASHRGHGLVTVGPGQDPGVHAVAHVMNVALGNVGHTLSFTAETEPERRSHREAITELCREMNDGGVDLLLILGGNPILDAPADLDFAAALAGVERSVHLSLYRDETSHACTWHVPKAHYLEAWSDSRSYDGTYTIAQPLIEPLFGGKTAVEFLGFVLGEREVPGRDVVRAAYENNASSPSKKGWRKAIHDGFVRGAGLATAQPGLSGAGWQPRPADFAWEPAGQGRTEVVFTADHSVYDGRFANNGWLQELPDVMTKLTWDNAASINPATARDLGVRQGDMLTLRREGRTLEIPAYLMPGQAVGSIAVSLGYGRSQGGRVAEGAGFDVYPFRTTDAMNHATGVELSRGSGKYKLVTTQDHHALKNAEQGRGQAERLPELFREATLGEFREHPDFAKHRTHHPSLKSLWNEHKYETGHQWGMSIDLTACTGCGACIVACQAENNVSVVGKKEVGLGREMHWIRVDRYFKGEPENPEIAHQVVACQQCENAPCEQVCPVAATTHTSEGLNDMIYNRCIGTRYCANNCPYKVRRFNWFNNQTTELNKPELFKMARNPEVTVRSRGVMEKCTYCVQRIKAVTIPAKNEGRPVRDGEIVPACAQTCPAEAITFGDLNDTKSRVRRLQDSDRSYAMLSELNVRPRTQYLAKLRNPANGHHSGNGHAPAHGATQHGATQHDADHSRG